MTLFDALYIRLAVDAFFVHAQLMVYSICFLFIGDCCFVMYSIDHMDITTYGCKKHKKRETKKKPKNLCFLHNDFVCLGVRQSKF